MRRVTKDKRLEYSYQQDAWAIHAIIYFIHAQMPRSYERRTECEVKKTCSILGNKCKEI